MKQQFRGFSFRYKTTSIPRSNPSDRIVNRIPVRMNGIEYSSISDLISKNPELNLHLSTVRNIMNGKRVKKFEHLTIERI